MLHIPGLYLLENNKGRGVYTAEDLVKGDLIEICPIIKIPQGQLKDIDQSIFFEYYFVWDEKGYDACLALGYGSLYNHKSNANAEIVMDYVEDNIQIVALRNMDSGSEILIDYTGGSGNRNDLWFEELD